MQLLEREPLLTQLEEHLRLAAAGQGRMVLVGGEAGVGKTVLVDEFCRRVGGAATALRASCDALSTPGPLGPVRDLAPALGLQIEPHALDGDTRDALFRGVLAAIGTRTGTTLMVGEDAHWADGASLELLRFLGRRIGGLRALFVVTYRNDEIGPNHPLRLVLGDLATAPAVHRIGVSPLSEEAVQRMAADSGRDTAALHQLTGGNPFFLTEVLAAEDETVPTSVGDAILARAARLSPEARAVLDLAAVIGSTFEPELLLTVAGPVFDEVDECIARGLLGAARNGLDFRHQLTREAILTAIAPHRRRLLHARVLTALRKAPESDRDLARLAHYAEAAGDQEAVLEYAIAAAEQAQALHAPREAAAQYARALRFADRLPPADRARLFEGRAVACYMTDHGEEAIAARQSALALRRELGERLKEGDNLRWLSRIYWFQGQGAAAEAAAVAALDLLETLPPGPELAMAYSNLASLRMLDNDPEGTLRWGERAIALAEQLGETETLVHALTNVGLARFAFDPAQAEAELTRSLDLALAAKLHDHAGRTMTNLAQYARLWAMRLDEAERRFAAALAYAIEHDLDRDRWYLEAGHAELRVRQGEWDTAEEKTRHLLRQPILGTMTRILALTTLGQICVRRGSPEAAALLEEALALAERTGEVMRLGPVRAARAEAALLAGDHQRARGEALAVSDLVFTRGTRWQRGEFAWLLWQTGAWNIPRENLATPHALQLAGDFAGAAAAWQGIGCPYEEALALAECDDPVLVRRGAAIFEELGARPALRHAIRRLRALGVRDPRPLRSEPRAITRASSHGLTIRELEVLRLLAAGHSNRELGDLLFISPATAARHVANIYAKLGVDSRAQATAYAHQHGLT